MTCYECTSCRKWLPSKSFAVRNDRPRGRKYACKACCNEKNKPLRAAYNASEHGRKKAREAEARQRERIRSIIVAAKDVPCKDCGERHPSEAMDFDHRDQGSKRGLVSKMKSIGAVRAEIEKCDVVCAVCHRKRTAQQMSTDLDGFMNPRPASVLPAAASVTETRGPAPQLGLAL